MEDFGNLVVLAPHPDDESLGCGGLIATLADQGSDVSVVFVTDGSASHTSRTHPKDLLRRIREREAEKACLELGVPRGNIHFMREPDSQLQHFGIDRLQGLAERIASLMERYRCSTLAVPWRRDPHPDHIQVHRLSELILKFLRKSPIVLEYPIWLWTNGKRDDWPRTDETTVFRLDISEFLVNKRNAIQRHRSQLGMVVFDDPNGFELSKEYLVPFMKPEEFFFINEGRTNSTLAKAYFDNLYDGKDDPWNFKDSPYERIKYRASLSVLGEGQIGSALEIGCSIGIFTEMLAARCTHLLAIDISRAAIDQALLHCSSFENIEFQVEDVTDRFPNGGYDLITCCEVGYYLDRKDLMELFENMHRHLNSRGRILLVHWTPFVPDYPLTGDIVHDQFESFSEKVGDLRETVSIREQTYRLQLWQKDGRSN